MRLQDIAFVSCAVTDMNRARAFYEGVLGLRPNAPVGSNPYCIEYDIGTGTLALDCNEAWPASPDGMSVILEVDDFDDAMKHLLDHGVTFFLGPCETKVCH